MEVKPGYKTTEIGVIPESWEVIDLSNLCTLQRGFDITEATRCPGVIPVFSSSGVSYYHNRAMVFPPGVVTGRKGILGNVYLINEPFWPHDTTLWVKDFRGNHPPFVALMLQNFHLERLDAATSVPTLNRNNLAGHRMAIPPTKAEQEAIAGALSDTDTYIESLEQLIAKKRHVKQGAMQELLTGKIRLPDFVVKADYKQTEVGVIPEDWRVVRLGDLFEITSSKRVFQSEWKTEGIPFYRAREVAVLSEAGSVNNDLFISKQMYDDFRRGYGVPEVGDLLVTGVGTLGRVYAVPDKREFYFKDGNIIWFKIRRSVHPAYLRQLYLTPLLVNQIVDSSAGTTVGTYTISGAKKTVIPLPNPPEQDAIATILSDMDAEIAALDTKLAKARQIKQGMMQELLTGRIRLV